MKHARLESPLIRSKTPKPRKSKIFTFSMPETLFKVIEERRGEIKRSTFIAMILKEHFGIEE